MTKPTLTIYKEITMKKPNNTSAKNNQASINQASIIGNIASSITSMTTKTVADVAKTGFTVLSTAAGTAKNMFTATKNNTQEPLNHVKQELLKAGAEAKKTLSTGLEHIAKKLKPKA